MSGGGSAAGSKGGCCSVSMSDTGSAAGLESALSDSCEMHRYEHPLNIRHARSPKDCRKGGEVEDF
jgi:hypothetical protein